RTKAVGSLCLLSLLTLSICGRAATFVVTNTLDAGPGSFREALTNASLSPGVDVITFSNVSGQITLLSAPPTLEDTSIIGPGARLLTISMPRFVISSGRSATIAGIRITPSTNTSLPIPVYGGMISNGGSLFLKDCEIASANTSGAWGGAIYNNG